MADYRALAEQDIVGRCVVRDGTVVYANERLAALVGDDVESLVGRDAHAVLSLGTASGEDDGDGDGGDDEDGWNGGDDEDVTLPFRAPPDTERRVPASLNRPDRPPVAVTAHLARIEYEDDPATLVAVVPSGSGQADAGSVLERATADLVRATDRRDVCAVAAEAAAAVLDFEAVSVYTRDESGALTVVASEDEEGVLPDVVPTTGPVWATLLTGDIEVVSSAECGFDTTTDVLVVPLGDTEFLLAATGHVPRSDAAVEVMRLLATNVEGALDRVRREKRLARLHEATRELMVAETDEEIAEIAIDTARDVLAHDLCGLHLYDADRDTLVPIAVSERTRAFVGDDGEVPPFERGESLAFEVFEAGEARVYDRINEVSGVMDPETRLRSELIVPLGDRGVFLTGSALPAHFDDTDVSLVKVLCANVEAALERAERETAFREQQAELEERNDRLDEFASLVSHDLRNPLNVAQGRLELAREECASEHLDTVAESHDQMAALIDDLLTLARQGRGLGDTESVDVAALARTCWQAFEEGELVVEEGLTVEADRSRLRELVENLLRNATEHAGPDPTVRVGVLGSPGAPEGFYIADDGPGIPPDDREQVFEHGYSTDSDGTGFGLAIVKAVADAHGWDVRVTTSESGGARFELLF